MTVTINTDKATTKINRELKKILSKRRSLAARAINKELTAGRKVIVEDLMDKTGLKRKTLNDRFVITRANPKKDLTGRITPIYGRRIYMALYPFAQVLARGGKKVIRLLSPIYRKNMRTGFMSKDGSRMYLRNQDKRDNVNRSYVSAVKGRSVPRLFDEFKMKDKYEQKIYERVLAAVKGVFSE